MRVSPVLTSRDLVSRKPSRRVVNPAGVTRSSALRSGRSAGSVRVGRKALSPHRDLRARRQSWQNRSTEPENQAVVDEEVETDSPEKTEEETVEEAAPVEQAYAGPGAEVLKKLQESESEELKALLPEMEQALVGLFSDKSAVEDRCGSAESELEEMKSKYLRLSADFENYRKRADNEREQLRTATKGDVIETLLPLIDNFELARTQIKPQNETEEAIVTNFMGLYRQMVDLFNQLGVEAIDCDQKPFDPEFHDAMLREQNNDLPDGTVMQELRKGFTIKGKLLRPAMVKVSYSDDVLQETELPMEEIESTMELDKSESEDVTDAE